MTDLPLKAKHKAVVELVFAGALWGFGFVATIWALESYPSNQVVFFRFLISWIAGFSIERLFLRKSLTPMKHEYQSAILPGLLLCGFMFLQTYGLKFTTATKSSFITTLYVLFVPLLNAHLFKQRINWIDFPLAGLALVGMFFLLGADFAAASVGDWITLVAAFLGALHIIYVGFAARKSQDSFTFNNAQSFWVMVFSVFLLLIPETNSQSNTPLPPLLIHSMGELKPVSGILFLALFSSLIAFTIQVRAQKILSDQTASQLFLLEAPFSFGFAFLFLGETLNTTQLFGAFVILLSTFLSTRTEMQRK